MCLHALHIDNAVFHVVVVVCHVAAVVVHVLSQCMSSAILYTHLARHCFFHMGWDGTAGGVALDDICIAGQSSTHGNPQFSAPCLSPPSGWVHRGRGLLTPANGTLKGTAKFMLGILTNRFTGPFTGPSFLGKKRFTGPLSGPSLQQVAISH